ncbi:CBS and ACT domain-containing protein [Xylocopilactobacillus apis]|uniref:CBS domain-containing protein n=1 Tax=Xylocopilactobacillus apis TaxID=2932183 RepID=A0AAU9CZH3_9LACO|nr:CBS and ACT domain-containing protein [Xylocopilactobacillus apis]BDR55646.1 CBS domain-containing protein [Xylocopilactobacillus apis]
MAVIDYMTKDLITVSLDEHINEALDMMKSNHINQIPVLKDGKLAGLITREDIAAALPSSSTSLSVYEINYLISKAMISDVMEKDVATISSDAQLEDAVKIMLDRNINVVVVEDNNEVKGIVTKNDVFDAFLQIAGYDLKNSSFIRVKVAEDAKGVIAKIGEILANNGFTILNLVVIRHSVDRVIELHVEGKDLLKLNKDLTEAGFDLE